MPLLTVLRNDFGLKSPKYGCGAELCGACKVLVDGVAVPSCQLPAGHAAGLEIKTVEGLADGEALHPLQEAFLEEQAGQCGFCTGGMIIAAQGLLNSRRYPTDDDIREALSTNLCRCGVYDRARRAIKLRIGRPEPAPIYQVIEPAPLDSSEHTALASPSLDAQPELDDWIRFNPDRSVTVFSGKVELGQGIRTALAQIAADELDVALARIRLVTADTERSPDEGGTTGSRSLETSGAAISIASAEARHHLLSLAFEQLDSQTPARELVVADGVISDPRSGRRDELLGTIGWRAFQSRISGAAPFKNPSAYRLVGSPARRLDLFSKVSGGVSYVQDMEMPAMLHARVLRPPAYHAQLVKFDRAAIQALPVWST